MNNYSSDMIIKAAFTDELKNYFELLPVEAIDYELLTVMEYMRKRVDEITGVYK